MYDAFISYRHSELDRFVAENLHRKLESFRLPKSMVRQRGKNCKKRIERVFRDRDELPLASSLADPITKALGESEFLIVICSPRLKESLWCKKEIETFIKMHGQEKILAVLAEGEPEESFPEELLSREKKVRNEDGSVTTVSEKVEPLAADVRGKNKREILKAMNQEILRLAAAMFQCSYDDLKQRHKEQKMKKAMTASLIIGSVFLLFGAVSTAMAVRIQKQKARIEQQSAEIEMQYQEALKNHSENLAEDSGRLLRKGDRIEALRTALTAFEDTGEGVSMPRTAEAESALAGSTYLYRNGTEMSPLHMLKHDTNVCFMKVSGNREKVLSADQSGGIYVWNVESGKKLLQIQTGTIQNENTCCFLTDDLIAFNREQSLEIYDCRSKRTVFRNPEKYSVISASEDGKYFALGRPLSYRQDEILIYDLESFQKKCSYCLNEEYSLGTVMKFNENSRFLAFVRCPSVFSEKTGSSVMILDLTDGSVSMEQPIEFSYVSAMNWEGNLLYVGANETLDDRFPDGNYDYTASLDSLILKLDAEQGKTAVSREIRGKTVTDILLAPEARHLTAVYYSDAALFDTENLKFMEGYSFGSQIVRCEKLGNSELYAFLTRNGDFCIVNGENLQQLNYGDYFSTGIANFKDYSFAGKGVVLLSYQSKDIVCYGKIMGRDWKELLKTEEGVSGIVVNPEETMALIQMFSSHNAVTVLLFDLKNGSVAGTVETEGNKVNCGFVKDGKNSFYICDRSGNLKVYSGKDGTVLKEYETLPAADYREAVQSSDGTKIIFQRDRGFTTVDLTDGEREETEYGSFHWEKIQKAGVDRELGIFAFLDCENQNLQIFNLGEKEPFLKIDLLASYVDDFYFIPGDSRILVQYMDCSIQIFDTGTGEMSGSMDDFDIFLEKVICTGNNLVLIGNSKGYLAGNDGKIVAMIDGLKNVLPDSGSFLATGGKTVYQCPEYSVEELVEYGRELLADYGN